MSRRSRRQARKKSRLGRSLRWLCGGLALVAIAAVVGIVWLRSYLRTEDFRATLEKSVGRTFGGDVEIAELKWKGLQASSSSAETTSSRSPLGANARDISTELDLGAVFRGVWHVPLLQIRSLELDLTSGPITPDPEPPRTGLAKYLPDETQIDSIVIENFSGKYRDDNRTFALADVATVATRQPDPIGGYDVDLRGGTVTTDLPFLRELELHTAVLKTRSDAVHLHASEWSLLEGAKLAAIATYTRSSQDWSIDATISRLDLAQVVNDTWAKRVRGRGMITINAFGGFGRPTTTSGTIELDETHLSALPVLDRLAAYVDSARFRNITLDRATAKFSHLGDSITFRDIYLNSSGLMRVQGQLTVTGGDYLRGTLAIGIVPGLLSKIPLAEAVIFRDSKDGLRWTTITLDGPIDSLQEDLSRRMLATAQERMFQILPDSGKIALRHSGRGLDEGTQTLLDGISEITSGEGTLLERMTRAAGNGNELIDLGRETVDDIIRDTPLDDILPGGVSSLPGANLIPGLIAPPAPAPEPPQEE